ncbi:hypothetical protein E2C01_064273 [Portunus trituberculatus]|uniref:Uncharacterized protein n=1 Tax=Portunus trituberculatus TaxID=210409 RepID=A0A5B7HMT2_PORTR|nr:hypothetical protein [Portunus trituberculatus]
MKNVRLHAKHNHLCYAFSTKRWVFDTETVIILRKITTISSKVSPNGRGQMPEAPQLWWILRRDWRNKTRYRNEIVIGGAQRRRQGTSLHRRIRGKEEIKNAGRISKTVCHMCSEARSVGGHVIIGPVTRGNV